MGSVLNKRIFVFTTGLFLFLFLTHCGPNPFSSHSEKNPDTLSIPVTLTNTSSSQTLDLTPTVATGIFVSVEGCASGNAPGIQPLSSGNVNLYKGDRSCLVKLKRFAIGSAIYASIGASSVQFSTWLANDIATFQNTTSTATVKVFVKAQVTQSGVLGTDTVQYNFTDVQAATADNLGTATVQTGVPLTVNGQAAPNFTMLASRFLSVNSNGSPNLSFTLQCGATLTGSTNPTYACSGDLLQTQIDFILIPDAYSTGAITVSQANTAFGANTPTTVGTLIVAPGGSDLNSNTVTNGGFYTSNASPLASGTSFHTSNVLMLRRKDTSSNTLSYLYFYVELSSTNPVSACGVYFSGGSGTSGDPYQVSDATGLANVGACGAGIYFIQTANIDLGGLGFANWTPISLSGNYNGANFTISNMYINSTSTGNFGLFSIINSGASVSNINVSAVNIILSSGGSYVGALAGQVSAVATATTSISNATSSGTIQTSGGNYFIGGLVGFVNSSGTSSTITLTSSSSSVTVSETGSLSTGNVYTGGLIGQVNGASPDTINVSNSSASGNINISNLTSSSIVFVGGLIGGSLYTGDTITNSMSTNNITFSSNTVAGTSIGMFGTVGGAGAQGGNVAGCFSSGTYSVSNSNVGSSSSLFSGGWIGGLIGTGVITNSISNSYTMATISSTNTSWMTVGGFLAGNDQNPTTISYAANPSISVTGGSNNVSKGFFGSTSGSAAHTNLYMYQNGSVPTDSFTGLTIYTTTTQMQTQTNFSGFTFGTNASVQNWKMPSANPLSPTGLLSPVQYWQCGSNGITCP